MGNIYYLACKGCKEMMYFGKLAESGSTEEDQLLRKFVAQHHYGNIYCHLVLTGTDWNVDNEIINFKKDKKGKATNIWETEYKFIQKIDEKGE